MKKRVPQVLKKKQRRDDVKITEPQFQYLNLQPVPTDDPKGLPDIDSDGDPAFWLISPNHIQDCLVHNVSYKNYMATISYRDIYNVWTIQVPLNSLMINSNYYIDHSERFDRSHMVPITEQPYVKFESLYSAIHNKLFYGQQLDIKSQQLKADLSKEFKKITRDQFSRFAQTNLNSECFVFFNTRLNGTVFGIFQQHQSDFKFSNSYLYQYQLDQQLTSLFDNIILQKPNDFQITLNQVLSNQVAELAYPHQLALSQQCFSRLHYFFFDLCHDIIQRYQIPPFFDLNHMRKVPDNKIFRMKFHLMVTQREIEVVFDDMRQLVDNFCRSILQFYKVPQCIQLMIMKHETSADQYHFNMIQILEQCKELPQFDFKQFTPGQIEIMVSNVTNERSPIAALHISMKDFGHPDELNNLYKNVESLLKSYRTILMDTIRPSFKVRQNLCKLKLVNTFDEYVELEKELAKMISDLDQTRIDLQVRDDEVYYLDVVFDIVVLKQNLNSFINNLISEIKEFSKSCVKQICDKLQQQIEKQALIFQKSPNNPQGLVDMLSTNEQIIPFIKEVLKVVYEFQTYFITDYSPFSLVNEEQISSVIDELIKMFKYKQKQNKFYEHKKRVFSKLVLQFTDFQQFYINQLDLMIDNCVKLENDDLYDESRNAQVFKRRFKWLFTGLTYKPISQFFDTNQENYQEFIDQINNDIQGLNLQRYEDTKLLFDKQQEIDLPQIFNEIHFLMNHMTQCQVIAKDWSTSLKVECYMTIDAEQLKNKFEPLYFLYIQNIHFVESCSQMKTMMLGDANVSSIVKEGEDILKNIRFINANEQYKSWQQLASDTIDQTIARMQVLFYLNSIKTGCLAETHLIRLNNILNLQINSELQVNIDELVKLLNTDQRQFIYDQVFEVIEQAKYNDRIINKLQAIQKIVDGIQYDLEAYDFPHFKEWKEMQINQNFKFVIIVNVQATLQNIDKSMYVISKFIQENPIISTQKYCRDLEQQLLHSKQFVMSLYRSMIQIKWLCDNYLRFPENETTKQLLVIFSQLCQHHFFFQQKISNGQTEKLINRNLLKSQQFSHLIHQFDQQQQVSVKELKSNRVFHFIEYRKWSFNQQQLCLCSGDDKIPVPLHLKDQFVSFKDDLKEILQPLADTCHNLFKEGKFQEAICNFHYQFLIQEFVQLETVQLKQVQVLLSGDIPLKADILNSLKERVNDFIRNERFKLFLRTYINTGNYWNGQVIMFETFPFNDQYMGFLEDVIISRTMRIPFLLLGDRICGYTHRDYQRITLFLSRLLGLKQMIITLFESDDFDDILESIGEMIKRGYLIQLSGIEFLSLESIMKLLALLNRYLQNEFAPIVPFQQGHVVMYIPMQAYSVEQIMIDIPQLKRILNYFTYKRTGIIFHSIFVEFGKFNSQHVSKPLTYIATYLSNMHFISPQLPVPITAFLLDRCKEPNVLSIAISTYCYIADQLNSPSLLEAFRLLVASSFGFPLCQIQQDHKYLKTNSNITNLTEEGNYHFGVLRYYLPLGCVCLLSKSQQISLLFVQHLKDLGLNLFYVFDQKDLDEQIDQVMLNKQSSIIVFILQDIAGYQAKSLMGNILAFQQINHHLTMSNGRIIDRVGIKSIVILNQFDREDVIQTPISWALRKVRMKPEYFNYDYLVNYFIINPLRLNQKIYNYHYIHLSDQIRDFNSCRAYYKFISKVQAKEELSFIEEQTSIYDIASQYLKLLIEFLLVDLLKSFKIEFDLRGWLIFRSCFIYFLFVVGIIKMDYKKYFDYNIENQAIEKYNPRQNDVQISLGNYQFEDQTSNFISMDLIFNQQFISDRKDKQKIITALTLASVAALINAFNILFIKYFQQKDFEVTKLLTTIISLFRSNKDILQKYQLSVVIDDLASLKVPGNNFFYLALQKGERIVQAADEENSQNDDFGDLDDEIENLDWIEFYYGKNLLDNQYVGLLRSQCTKYSIPLAFDSEQSMSVVFLAAIILGHVPVLITGPPQSGKTTMLSAAVSILNGIVQQQTYVSELSDLTGMNVVETIMKRNYITEKNNLESQVNKVDLHHIRLLIQKDENHRYEKLDQFLYFIGQKIINMIPLYGRQIQSDMFPNSLYYGTVMMKHISIVIESNYLPDQIKETQLFIFQIEEPRQQTYIDLVSKTEPSMKILDVQQFVKGLFLIQSTIKISLYLVLQQMKQYQMYITKEDQSMQQFTLSLFINALRATPRITVQNLLAICDEIKTALSVSILDHESFWGALDLSYLSEIQQSDREKYEAKKVNQYTTWEIEVLQARQEYAQQHMTEEESGSSDSDNVNYQQQQQIVDNDDADAKAKAREAKREALKLQMLTYQHKFSKQLILNSDLLSIDPANFELYIDLYQTHGLEIDPTIANRMFMMHLMLQQQLERNSQKLAIYLNAVRCERNDLASALLPTFSIPSCVFYAFQMPYEHYFDSVQLLATLGNYQISNQKLFAQVNLKRQENEDMSDIASQSSITSATTGGGISSSMSSSSHSSFSSSVHSATTNRGEFEYSHQKNSRRKKRMLIDTTTLMQSITREAKMQQIPGKKLKLDNQLTMALYNCLQQKGETQATGYAIRAAFCQSLGISPIIALQDLLLEEATQVAPGGIIEAQVPNADTIIETWKHLTVDPAKTIVNVEEKVINRMVQYGIIQEPADILVIVPLSSLFSNIDNLSLISTIQAIQTGSAIYEIFKEEEIRVIAKLVALSHGITSVLTIQQVIAIASRSFSIAIFSDKNQYTDIMIPFSPVSRHSIVEQKMNAFLAGQSDQLKLLPLFHMTRTPCILMKNISNPFVMETNQDKQVYIEIFCKAVIAIFQFCEQKCGNSSLCLSLNAFARSSLRLANRKFKNATRFIYLFEPILKTIQTMDNQLNAQAYSQNKVDAQITRDKVFQIKEMMKYDYMRAISLAKNSAVDGVLLAVRIYYYPFMKLHYKNEVAFEIALGEVLKQERIQNFSMSSHIQQDGMASLNRLLNPNAGVLTLEEEQYEFITNIQRNISGYRSSILGLSSEDIDPIQNFMPLVKENIIQSSFIAESLIAIWAKKLRLRFIFISADVGLAIAKSTELFFQNVEEKSLSLPKNLNIINCCWPLNEFNVAVKNAFEEDNPIVFENIGSRNSEMEVIFFFQKLFLMILSNITKANQVVNIGSIKIQLCKPLHRCTIYYILEKELNFLSLLDFGVLNQSTLDQSILIQPQVLVSDSLLNMIVHLQSYDRFHTHQDIINKLQSDIQAMAQDLHAQQLFQLLNIRIIKAQINKQLQHFGKFLSSNNFLHSEITGVMKVFVFCSDIMTQIKDNINKRFVMFQEYQQNASLSNLSKNIATGQTALLMLIANLSQICPQVSGIFNDFFMKNFPSFIRRTLKQKASQNLMGELLLQSMSFFVSGIFYLLPEGYRDIFIFLSYMYYSIPFGMSKSYDIDVLKIALQPTQALMLSKITDQLLYFAKNDGKTISLQELTPLVFQNHYILETGWKSLLVINSVPTRFDELYLFFTQNHSMFAQLVLSPSIYDCIIGNYIFRFEQMNDQRSIHELFGEEVAQQIQSDPLMLPTSLQVPNFESLFSSLILGLLLQPLRFYQQIKRYDQIVPISPRITLKNQGLNRAEFYEEYVRKTKLNKCLTNQIPSDLLVVANIALENSRIVTVYYDTGCAVNYFLRLLHSQALHTAPLTFTLKPTHDQFERYSICLDTDYDIDASLHHLIQMIVNGFKPKHLLWVLIPVQWKMKIGIENEQYSNYITDTISKFCAISQCEITYVEKPHSLASSINYLLTLTNFVLKQRSYDFMALHYIVIKAIYIQMLKFACTQSRDILSFDDNNYIFEIDRILTLADNNQFHIIDISSLPPPVCSITCCNCTGGNSDFYSKLGMLKNPRYDKKGIVWKAIITDEEKSLMEVPSKVTFNDFINVFEKAQEFEKLCRKQKELGIITPSFMNQPFNIMNIKLNSNMVTKDFIQLICNDDVQYIDGKTVPLVEPQAEQPDLCLLSSELQSYLELSLNNHNIPLHIHKFSNIRDQRMIWQQDNILHFRGVIYYHVFGDILYYYQLFNTQMPHILKLNLEANRLMVIGLLEKPATKIVYNSKHQIKFTSEPLEFAVIAVTDFRMRGASYCQVARTVVDYMVQDDLGYQHEMNIYFVPCEPTEEEFEGSFDPEGIPLVKFDFRCTGASDHTFVYVRNQSGAPEEEWRYKQCSFNIGYF